MVASRKTTPVRTCPSRFDTSGVLEKMHRTYIASNLRVYFYKIDFQGEETYKYFIGIMGSEGKIFALKSIPFFHEGPGRTEFLKDSLGRVEVICRKTGYFFFTFDDIMQTLKSGPDPSREIENDILFGKVIPEFQDPLYVKAEEPRRRSSLKISAGDGSW